MDLHQRMYMGITGNEHNRQKGIPFCSSLSLVDLNLFSTLSLWHLLEKEENNYSIEKKKQIIKENRKSYINHKKINLQNNI